MLVKAPRLKNTIKSKTKSNVNVRPASEAMVGRLLFVDNVLANQLICHRHCLRFSQIELLTLLFLSSLAEEAKAKAFEEKSATIRAHHVKAVSKVS